MAGHSSNFLDPSDDEEEDPNRSIEILQANVQRLTEKCAALESQNILVSVQQLDILAKTISYILSASVLYLYWKAIILAQTHLSLDMLRLDLLQERTMRDNDDAKQFLSFVMAILQHPITAYVVRAVLMVYPYIHNQRTHGSMHRRFQVFAVAFIVIGRIKLCRWRENSFVQSGIASQSSGSGNATLATIPRFGESCTDDGIWEANYEISARFLYLSILRLRGLWTKTAQYMSSRADFVPVAYIRELSKLQDQAPATPWDQVEQKLLSPKLLKQLADIETTPLASASIGQVHIARLKSTNQKVVIKVQHPHARTLMMDDFWSLNVICKIVGWMEPDYAFMEILMREWAVEARKELDFNFEAQNMVDATAALSEWMPTPFDTVYTKSNPAVPFQVRIPTPIRELCNRDVLVMDFCEGCRVDEFDKIEEWGLSRSAIMDGISQTFAHYMYCSEIFNGDPHPGNILVRPGTHKNEKEGFTLILLDWGLAKRLPEQKRLAFCQMVYAAATFDYGLLLDSYKTVGLKMKREDAGQSMEDMRFFLRDMAPSDETRKRIKNKIKADRKKMQESKEKVPMESKAYPGDFFFFIRVNELLHGLGGSYSINLGYLDTLQPYAERGLRKSAMYDLVVPPPTTSIQVENASLQAKLEKVMKELEQDESLVGGQVCVLSEDGKTQASAVAGTLGGLRSHIPMTRDAVVLGYSTTKAMTASLAHIMVQEGYLSYDEPVCERFWKQFCPTKGSPAGLADALGLPTEEVERRWQWKRQITLRHILNHTSGLWAALPVKMTVKRMASCEECFAAFEYNPEAPQETLLPSSRPGETSAYHFLSFGWLVAGTLCGAYGLKKHVSNVKFADVYEDLLKPKLSQRTLDAGFYPMGGFGNKLYAQTVTSDVRASTLMQKRREASIMGENSDENHSENPLMKALENFKGKEFLLDPRIWNSADLLQANVPAAGGRFSAEGLASFYHDLSQGNLVPASVLNEILTSTSTSSLNDISEGSALQGVTQITSDPSATNTKLSFGYQRIRTDRDDKDSFSCLGHAGVGGSIGFWHVRTGLCVGVTLNKSDGKVEVTKRILTTIADHYNI
eukprot:scaffold3955_cov160-Cylindrotheca_fusiformis.AAC.15